VTAGPGCGECSAPRPGPGGTPLALRLSAELCAAPTGPRCFQRGEVRLEAEPAGVPRRAVALVDAGRFVREQRALAALSGWQTKKYIGDDATGCMPQVRRLRTLRQRLCAEEYVCLCQRITFELSGRQRQVAGPGLRRMYLTADRAWRLAVGAPLERGVRPRRTLRLKAALIHLNGR
jgi:hypothetical protein